MSTLDAHLDRMDARHELGSWEALAENLFDDLDDDLRATVPIQRIEQVVSDLTERLAELRGVRV